MEAIECYYVITPKITAMVVVYDGRIAEGTAPVWRKWIGVPVAEFTPGRYADRVVKLNNEGE